MWKKENMQELLDTNDRAVERGLVAIYRLQTDGERASRTTTNSNNVGFSAFDAEFLSEIAEKCIRWRGLTPGQIRAVRPKVRRYWRQLCDIANAKQEHPDIVESRAFSAAEAAAEAHAIEQEEADAAAQECGIAPRTRKPMHAMTAAGDHL